MRPVLIGGCPRSGTTLLGAMLGAHPSCLAIPESQFILEALADGRRREFEPSAAARRIGEHFRFKTWGVDIGAPSGDAAASISSYPELIEWFVARYGEAVGRPDPDVWVEHSPVNTKYAATLFELFPDARLIHLVRDGRAVAASIMGLEWGPNEIHTTAPWWAHRLSFGLAAESRFGPQRVLRVRYEDLVLEPAATLEKLGAFLDLDFDAAMLRADGLRVPEYTRRWHRLVGTRPDPERVEAWREQLQPRAIEIFEQITGELLTYLGYRPDFGLLARPMTRREKIVPFFRDHLFRRRINAFRFKAIAARTERAAGRSQPTPPDPPE